jgi:hypothetical protein
MSPAGVPAWRPKPAAVCTSILPIVAAFVAATCYFRRSALKALQSGGMTLYVRAGWRRYFSRRSSPAGYWVVVSWYLPARRGLRRGPDHSRSVAAMLGDK